MHQARHAAFLDREEFGATGPCKVLLTRSTTWAPSCGAEASSTAAIPSLEGPVVDCAEAGNSLLFFVVIGKALELFWAMVSIRKLQRHSQMLESLSTRVHVTRETHPPRRLPLRRDAFELVPWCARERIGMGMVFS
jgi:hypothetical protein